MTITPCHTSDNYLEPMSRNAFYRRHRFTTVFLSHMSNAPMRDFCSAMGRRTKFASENWLMPDFAFVGDHVLDFYSRPEGDQDTTRRCSLLVYTMDQALTSIVFSWARYITCFLIFPCPESPSSPKPNLPSTARGLSAEPSSDHLNT